MRSYFARRRSSLSDDTSKHCQTYFVFERSSLSMSASVS